MSNIYFKQFHKLDDILIDTANFLIESMKVMMEVPSVLQIKQSAITHMLELMSNVLSKNQVPRILEIGCGHGANAYFMAKNTNGNIIAIDSSNRMITQAHNSFTHPKIQYYVADEEKMLDLGFAEYFDACHADRLLVSSLNYELLFENVVRLVKPAGVLTFTDVDASSITITPYTNITKIILEQLKRNFVNKSMGSELAQLFLRNNLQNITAIPANSTITSFAILSKIFQFAEIIQQVVQQKLITVKDGEKWFDDMVKAELLGDFKCTVKFTTVHANKPLLSTL